MALYLQDNVNALRRMQGFTLTELIVTILIVGIITAFAIPSFTINNPSAEANALLGTLQYARFSAIKTGQSIIVCPIAAGSPNVCSSSSSWSSGWIVLAPANGVCTSTGGATGDLVLKTQPAFSTTDTASFAPPGSLTNNSFCFTKIGYAMFSGTGKVTINTNPAKTKLERCVVSSGVGHIQVLSNGQTDINGIQCQ